MSEPDIQRVTIIGNGAMATACALLLDSRGYTVTMWSPFAEAADDIVRHNENQRYLPGIPLPTTLRVTSGDSEALIDPDLIVSAIPTQFMRETWHRLAEHTPADPPIISVAKGLESDTFMRPTQIIEDVFCESGPRKLAALSGPSIADELARCLPATVCIAVEDNDLAESLQQVFTTRWLRVYTKTDVRGVELAGATKNVIAIAAGILDGLQAGYNAKSALLSRGLAEIARLGMAMGAEQETFFGITGVGDLATTCFCPMGRNRSAGELLGKGRKLDDVLNEIQGIVEGVPTTRAVMALAREHKVEMPITAAVNAVLFEGLDPIEGISMLMSRTPKEERVA